MRKLHTLVLVSSLVLLGACRAEISSDRHHDRSAPELESFHIVDSYLTNSEFDNDRLRISPFIDDGEFELFWEVSPRVKYRAELFINDRPSTDNAISISNAWCGPGENCGNFSYQYCQYQSDLRLDCAQPERTSPSRNVNISWLFDDVPEELFFILEVCDDDLFYCENRSRAVTFE